MSNTVTPSVAKNMFSEWLSSGDEAGRAFRKWSMGVSKEWYRRTGMKGFITLEFDTAIEAIAYTLFSPEMNGSYTVIDRNGLPGDFKSTYDEADLNTSFLLYVVFGKKEPGCMSMMRHMLA